MLISELQVYITLKRKLYLIYIMTTFFKEGEDRHCELCYEVDFFQLLFILCMYLIHVPAVYLGK